MERPFGRAALALVTFGVLVAGCGRHPRTELPAPTPPAAASDAADSSADAATNEAIARLIETSEQHFAEGERELALGHLDRAREAFDRAVDVLLASPLGARSIPRLREHFDRLVDRITAQELLALAQGDGFTEQRYEPATIDQLLAESLFTRPAPTEELKRTVEANLAEAMPEVPIPLNPAVLSSVELLQGPLRDRIEEGLRHASRYLPMVQRVFREEGLPLDLAYLPLIESAFKPTALSRARAKGIWQFMRPTAREHGLKEDWFIDERSDPEKATRAAAAYLRWLYDLFDGDWHLALASYNGGPGRVQRAIRRSGRRDFWSLATGSRLLPRETREYVPLLLAAVIIGRNPAQFGFEEIDPEPPPPPDRVPVSRPVDIRRVAEWTGVPVEEIRALNPELRRWTTPLNASDYEIKVPAGRGDTLRARLAEANPEDVVTLNWHTVRRGESLSSIARRFRVSRADLAAANDLSSRAWLRIGQRLVIPRPPALGLAARADGAAPPAAEGTIAQTDDQTPVVYRVRRGDTLTSIARRFGVTIRLLMTWNQLRSDRITVGDRLTVHPSAAVTSTQQ